MPLEGTLPSVIARSIQRRGSFQTTITAVCVKLCVSRVTRYVSPAGTFAHPVSSRHACPHTTPHRRRVKADTGGVGAAVSTPAKMGSTTVRQGNPVFWISQKGGRSPLLPPVEIRRRHCPPGNPQISRQALRGRHSWLPKEFPPYFSMAPSLTARQRWLPERLGVPPENPSALHFWDEAACQ